MRDLETKKDTRANYARANRDKIYAQDTLRRRQIARHVRQIKCAAVCVDCDRRFPDFPEVLEFDHIGTDKVASIARMVSQGVSLAKIDAEIAKCELVCANCHRIRTISRK